MPHREPALAPAEHAAPRVFRERVRAHEEREHRAPKALHKLSLEHRRQRDEPPIEKERPVGGEHLHVHVRVQTGDAPEGLYEQD